MPVQLCSGDRPRRPRVGQALCAAVAAGARPAPEAPGAPASGGCEPVGGRRSAVPAPAARRGAHSRCCPGPLWEPADGARAACGCALTFAECLLSRVLVSPLSCLAHDGQIGVTRWPGLSRVVATWVHVQVSEGWSGCPSISCQHSGPKDRAKPCGPSVAAAGVGLPGAPCLAPPLGLGGQGNSAHLLSSPQPTASGRGCRTPAWPAPRCLPCSSR